VVPIKDGNDNVMIAINVANYYNDTKGKVVVVEWRVVANDGKKLTAESQFPSPMNGWI